MQIEVEQEETMAPPTLEDAIAQHNVSVLTGARAMQDQRKRTPVVRAHAHAQPVKAKKRKTNKRSREEADRCPIRSPTNQLASTTSSQPLPLPQMQMQQAAPMPLTAIQTLGTCLIGGSMDQAGVRDVLERLSMSSASSSVEVNVEAKKMEMADLFQYKITSAVNVNRNQSALVPFLHTEFNGVKASVYNK
ncbi:uncharacterized protein ACA1_095930, partial [Acanthamoeba castellanii str. Neff]